MDEEQVKQELTRLCTGSDEASRWTRELVLKLSSGELEHTWDEEWIWNVDDQDYRILVIHHDDCVACMMGVPIEEEN